MLGPPRSSNPGCALELFRTFDDPASLGGTVVPCFERILCGISPEAGELIESAGDPESGAGVGGSLRAVLELLFELDPLATFGPGAGGSLRTVTIVRSPR